MMMIKVGRTYSGRMRVISTTAPNTKPNSTETRMDSTKRQLPFITTTALGAASRKMTATTVSTSSKSGAHMFLMSFSLGANSCLLPGLALANATSAPLKKMSTIRTQKVPSGSCAEISAKGSPAVAILAATMLVRAYSKMSKPIKLSTASASANTKAIRGRALTQRSGNSQRMSAGLISGRSMMPQANASTCGSSAKMKVGLV